MIDLNSMNILIVDDAQIMCKSIRDVLRVLKYGKRFYYANNGLEAWEILEKEHVDLAIVDWNMPVMSGGELVGRIRKDKRLRDMPVIMVTAERSREIVAEAAESNVDAYILKPLTIGSLGDKISRVIEEANNPTPVVRHLNKARDLEEAEDIDAAIEQVKLAVKADPLSSRPVRELGLLFFKKNDLDTAEKCLLKAAKMNKLDVFAFHQLGELYLKRNDIEKAAHSFEKAMTISPRHVSRGIFFGKILVQKGMVKKAVEVFDKAIELSNDPMPLHEQIADLCMQNEIYDYAIKLMDSILKNTPTRYDLIFKIGIANEKIGEHSKALRCLAEAAKKDRDNIEIRVHMARNLIALGEVLKAEQVLKTVLKIDSDNEEAKDLIRKCG